LLSIPRRFFGFRLGRRFGGLRSLVLGSSFVLGAFRVRGIVAAPVALRRRGFVAALALRTSGSFTVVGRLAVEQLGEAARLRADRMVLRARATRTGQGRAAGKIWDSDATLATAMPRIGILMRCWFASRGPSGGKQIAMQNQNLGGKARRLSTRCPGTRCLDPAKTA